MTTFETSALARSRRSAKSSYFSSIISATLRVLSPRLGSQRPGSLVGAAAGPTRISAAILGSLTHIRGRSGLDVVGSPAELRAEVAGWPRKSTGTKASANKNELALAA